MKPKEQKELAALEQKVLEILKRMKLLHLHHKFLPQREQKGYTISIGELIDVLTISNIKIWHLEERISKLTKSNKTKDKIELGELVKLIRAANRERVAMKEEFNLRLEGRTRALNKVEHTRLGR